MQANRVRRRAVLTASSPQITGTAQTAVVVLVEPISVEIEKAPELTGASRTRVFLAVREKQLTIRKAGKQSLVELAELKRWVSSLPTRGRQPEAA